MNVHNLHQLVRSLAATAGLIVVAIMLLLSWWVLSATWDNWRYAERQFGHAVEIERVIGSKRWHWQAFGCTYAIVVLTPASAKQIADRGPAMLSHVSVTKHKRKQLLILWPKTGWAQAPISSKVLDSGESVYSACLGELDKDDTAAVRQALLSKTVWRSGRRAFVDLESRIAGLIRFGD